MSGPRKVRRDSRLKSLPEDRRAQIIGWLESDGAQSCLQRMRAELGIESSQTALYEALSYWRLQATFSQADAETKAVEALLLEEFPDATPEKIAAAGQLVFTMRAKNSGDDEKFLSLEAMRLARDTAAHNARMDAQKLAQKDRQLGQKDKEIKLAIEKFQFDGAKAALSHLGELKSIAADRTLSDDQKIEQVRLKLWGAPPKEMEGKG